MKHWRTCECDEVEEEEAGLVGGGGKRNERHQWMCVCLIVLIGSLIGCLFVGIREALGMKM